MRNPNDTRVSPGDIIAIETPRGVRHVQVTHLHPCYPEVLRAITPTEPSDPTDIAKRRTSFTAMADLAAAIRDKRVPAKIVGHAVIPAADRPFPTFRVPIRNKAGEIIYWWTWDGEGLAVAPEGNDASLPIREVLPIGSLCQRLADLA